MKRSNRVRPIARRTTLSAAAEPANPTTAPSLGGGPLLSRALTRAPGGHVTGFIKLTLRDGRALALRIESIESVEPMTERDRAGEHTHTRSYVRTRSGDCHYVREDCEPLQAMLLGQGRELSPAEEAEVTARLKAADPWADPFAELDGVVTRNGDPR